MSRDVAAALAELERLGSRAVRDGYARYGIVAPKSFGVAMNRIQRLARELGRDQVLARGLWESGWYEARLLAAYVGEPEKLTAAEMESWCRDFDNWGVVDTVCFALFDRSPHAFAKVGRWAGRRGEFQKRAAFALLACLAAHDRESPDARFRDALALVERAASDDRNFVKKGVSWALRMIGRRSGALLADATAVARRLAASPAPAARWVGREALRDLERASARRAR